MHRHEVEPGDADDPDDDAPRRTTSTLTPVPPTATAIFFGASYHADYATILAAPADLPAVADALAAYLRRRRRRPAAVGRRRPAPAALRRPGRRRPGRGVRRARDRRGLDAQRRARGRLPGRRRCPPAATSTTTSRTLGKKERHEIRRKVRRAEAVGEVRLDDSADPLADLDAFIDLHQKKLGRRRPVPATRPAAPRAASSSGACSSSTAPDGPLRLAFLSVGGRRIAAGIHFETADALPLLQRRRRPGRARPVAGRPDGPRATSQRALAAGVRRLDFLRGNEPYKYEWGAVDEPIQRLLVRRRDG